eukprot:CAMPEP_0175590896 /NCGR_PEP_ID=MMETSP0096-20121207/52581_1 /TAXON_ID=311494 /ORGANISM="Alexandrium monilatum, Strain CCMP3105" /LENGTH=188 /DNA_ID=CAMNT_0016894999 /DNA_START=81 /DNA_END=644 /DNA_ORIENTATION=-
MRLLLLLLGVLQRAGSLKPLPGVPARRDGSQLTERGTGTTLPPFESTMPELDPEYHFVCVWRPPRAGDSQGREATAQPRAPPQQTPLALPPGDPNMDLCVLSLRKITWAIIFTVLSIISIILCVPFLLIEAPAAGAALVPGLLLFRRLLRAQEAAAAARTALPPLGMPPPEGADFVFRSILPACLPAR